MRAVVGCVQMTAYAQATDSEVKNAADTLEFRSSGWLCISNYLSSFSANSMLPMDLESP